MRGSPSPVPSQRPLPEGRPPAGVVLGCLSLWAVCCGRGHRGVRPGLIGRWAGAGGWTAALRHSVPGPIASRALRRCLVSSSLPSRAPAELPGGGAQSATWPLPGPLAAGPAGAGPQPRCPSRGAPAAGPHPRCPIRGVPSAGPHPQPCPRRGAEGQAEGYLRSSPERWWLVPAV